MKVGRVIFLSAFAAVSTLATAQPSSRSFVEDNDLWMEDTLESIPAVTQELFNQIIALGKEAYQPFADQNKESLTINARWDDSTVNANVSRMVGVTINMYGGLARRPEVTPDGFALVLCHELGHAYAGIPYLQQWRKLSAEGQADYYGAGVCLQQIMEKLPLDMADIQVTPYIEGVCKESQSSNQMEYNLCLRKLAAGQSLGNLLAVLKKEPQPNFETPDPTVVDATLLSYPATIQCRVDTYRSGALNLPRPACWFKN